jgi:indole-3-glycerol phosphate synthase
VESSKLSILEQIVVRKRAELLLDRERTRLGSLEARARAARSRGFRRALERSAPAVIAEIKRASPSRGVIAGEADPAGVARRYEAAGAAALSVLTDQVYFQGSLEDLEAAGAATRLPLLRKDFTLDAYHVWQAAAHGADAILLIVAILRPKELRELLGVASEAGLDALVEVHDRAELDSALEAGATLIGVNNRNLKTFEVRIETSLDLAPAMPPNVLAVSESGLRRPEDLQRLAAAGYRAFLIGESLMSQPDPGAALETLLAGVHSVARSH